MTYHTIKFFENPGFAEIREIAREFYVQLDYTANGSYCIVPELKGNGKINKVNLHYLHPNDTRYDHL